MSTQVEVIHNQCESDRQGLNVIEDLKHTTSSVLRYSSVNCLEGLDSHLELCVFDPCRLGKVVLNVEEGVGSSTGHGQVGILPVYKANQRRDQEASTQVLRCHCYSHL